MTIAKNQQELWKYEVSSIDQSLLVPFCIACPVLPFLKKKPIVTHVKNLRLMPLHFMIFYNKKRNSILLQKRDHKNYTRYFAKKYEYFLRPDLGTVRTFLNYNRKKLQQSFRNIIKIFIFRINIKI
jgi:hypothetical protein